MDSEVRRFTHSRLPALALGGLVALLVAMGIGRFVYTPILPLMVEALDLSKAEAGLIASANFAGYLAGALLAAMAALPGSRRTWLLGALAGSGLTTLAMALVSTMSAFLLLRFLGGVASAFVLVFASTLVLDRLGSGGRGDLIGVHFAGVGTGIALSALLVAWLVAAGYGWSHLWLVFGLLSLIALPVVAALVPDLDDGPSVSSVGRKPADPAFRSLVAAYGLFGFGYVITATFIVAMVRSSPQAQALESLVWLLVGLTAVPSVLLWNRVGGRIGVARALALACAIEAAGVAASVLWPTVTGMALAAVLLGATFMGITALGLVGARRLARGDARRALALMTAAFGLGQVVGPLFAGIVRDRTGSFLVPSLAATAALLIAALLAARLSARLR